MISLLPVGLKVSDHKADFRFHLIRLKQNDQDNQESVRVAVDKLH